MQYNNVYTKISDVTWTHSGFRYMRSVGHSLRANKESGSSSLAEMRIQIFQQKSFVVQCNNRTHTKQNPEPHDIEALCLATLVVTIIVSLLVD